MNCLSHALLIIFYLVVLTFELSNGREFRFVSWLSKKKCSIKRVVLLYGGSISQQAEVSEKVEGADYENQSQSTCAVIISTSLGSKYLDKRKKLIVASNSTVSDIKDQLAQKFPGSPPKRLQRVFFQERLLSDDETIGNLTDSSTIPLTLDMVTGTSTYNRTFSVGQAIEAYASTVVQLTYIGDKLKDSISGDPVENGEFESTKYRELLDEVQRSVYEKYAEDISIALENEANPEVITDDTALWRNRNNAGHSPLWAAIAKEFNIYSHSFTASTLKIFLVSINSISSIFVKCLNS
jgi:hypothetical protein